MSFSSNTYYSTLKRINGLTTPPTGFLSTWDQSVAANAGSGAFPMDATTSAAVLGGQSSYQNSSFTTIATATNKDFGVAQFVSSPLTAQTVATSGTTTWSVRAAAQISNAAANFTWTFRAALYLVNGSTGAIRSTIFVLSNIGSTGRSLTSEQAVQATGIATNATGSPHIATAGDYLAIEWGINMNNTSGGNLAPNITIFADGVTPITADTGVVSNAASDLICSAAILTTPIIQRSQIANPFVIEYLGPGTSRAQIDQPPIIQYVGPGLSRAQIAQPPVIQAVTGKVNTVLMRGFDSTSGINKIVYWIAAGVDSSAEQYSGIKQNVTDIVVVKFLLS